MNCLCLPLCHWCDIQESVKLCQCNRLVYERVELYMYAFTGVIGNACYKHVVYVMTSLYLQRFRACCLFGKAIFSCSGNVFFFFFFCIHLCDFCSL
jgi:hypothetical protein